MQFRVRHRARSLAQVRWAAQHARKELSRCPAVLESRQFTMPRTLTVAVIAAPDAQVWQLLLGAPSASGEMPSARECASGNQEQGARIDGEICDPLEVVLL